MALRFACKFDYSMIEFRDWIFQFWCTQSDCLLDTQRYRIPPNITTGKAAERFLQQRCKQFILECVGGECHVTNTRGAKEGMSVDVLL